MSFAEFIVEDDELISICSKTDNLDEQERKLIDAVKGRTKLTMFEGQALLGILRKRGVSVLRPVQ